MSLAAAAVQGNKEAAEYGCLSFTYSTFVVTARALCELSKCRASLLIQKCTQNRASAEKMCSVMKSRYKLDLSLTGPAYFNTRSLLFLFPKRVDHPGVRRGRRSTVWYPDGRLRNWDKTLENIILSLL